MKFILLCVLGFIIGTKGDQCITPDDEDGECVYIKSCKSLMDILGKPYKTDLDRYIIRAHGHACQHTENHADVCCPISKRMPPETTTMKTYVNIQRCWTPNGKPGSCVPILDCMSLRKLSVKSHRTYQETELLKQSICESDNLTYKVCCSENEIEKNRDLLPTTEECGKYDAIRNRIIGGAQTGIEEYPWTALLFYINGRGDIERACGGSLINKYYVITAAHCTEENEYELFKVRLGDWNITGDVDCDGHLCGPPERTMEIYINNILRHPRYNPRNLDYDVALLRLEDRVEYTRFIKPICLPMDMSIREKRYDGHSATIVGWGLTEANQLSDIKLKATVQIVKKEFIYGNNGKQIRAREYNIYATGNGKDSCRGDSGGPLMIKEEVNENKNWYLIGIIAYGNLKNKCGTEESIGIYARVSSFLDWINDTIRT